MSGNDFYEDDEPVEDVQTAFEAGSHGTMLPPAHSITACTKCGTPIVRYLGEEDDEDAEKPPMVAPMIYHLYPIVGSGFPCGELALNGLPIGEHLCRYCRGCGHRWCESVWHGEAPHADT